MDGTLSRFGTDLYKFSNESGCYIWANTRLSTKGMILRKKINDEKFVKVLGDHVKLNSVTVVRLLELDGVSETEDVFHMLYHDADAEIKDLIITLDTGTLKDHKLSSILHAIVTKFEKPREKKKFKWWND